MASVASAWTARGVDGFRVDAARHLYESDSGQLADVAETHAYFKTFRAQLKPGTTLVAEAWTDRAGVLGYRGDGDEFTQAFDFDLAQAIVAALLSGRAALLTEQLKAVRPWDFEATFLSNHDMDRLATRLYGDAAAVKAAHVLLLTLPGTPYLYYGDELGMRNGSEPGDPGKRTVMPWNDVDKSELVPLIAQLTRQRAQLGAFALEDSHDPHVVAFARGKVHIRVNVSEEDAAGLPPRGYSVVSDR